MDLSRRFFIGSALSFTAFSGCRVFRAPGGLFSGAPKLKFGVVSDIHIMETPGDTGRQGDTKTFVHTLEWFRDQKVDAVMIAGDMADNGMVEQLQKVADAWFKVFPNNKAPDGRTVEKVFIYGNHDWEGAGYGGYAKKRFPNDAERPKHVLSTDYKGNWERIFQEEYAPIYLKQIKGYSFIGHHWDGYGRREKCSFDRIEDFMSANGKKLDPALPFFYTQHPHPKDTCYGPWAWGHDSGVVTKTLSAFPNAIAFSGHSHYSLTDERSIWQDTFTSIGTSSLRYSGRTYDSRPPCGYENTGAASNRDQIDPFKMMPNADPTDCRQGMLVSVYSDHITFTRREFLTNLFVGDDWVMPLPAAESKPYAFAVRKQQFRAPEFPADAKLYVTRIKATNRGGAGVPKAKKDAFKLAFPSAIAVKGARPHEYEINIIPDKGEKKSKYVIATGYNHSLESPKARLGDTCVIAADITPSDQPFHFEVVPLDSFWNAGKPLVSQKITRQG